MNAANKTYLSINSELVNTVKAVDCNSVGKKKIYIAFFSVDHFNTSFVVQYYCTLYQVFVK